MTKAAPGSGFFMGARRWPGIKKRPVRAVLHGVVHRSEDETTEEEAERHCHGDGGHTRDE